MTSPSYSDVHRTEVDRTDVEEAAATLPRSMRLDHHGPAARFTLHRHVMACDPFSVEETWCSDGIRMHLVDESEYAVGVPVRGPLHAENRGEDLDVGPGRAAVFAPDTETDVVTDDGGDVVLVHIRSAALEDALEALLGRPVRRPLPLPTSMALDTEAGRALATTIREAVDAGPGAASVLGNPMSAEPLKYRLLARLLMAADHPEREALDGRVPTWGPRTVHRCVELIEAHPERPYTLAGLAAGAGLSVRALEGCWLRHRDRLPADDIGRTRLDRAHRDLEERRPGETTVAAVAVAWGFRPPWFATAYARRYGRTPAETLRGPAFA